jgi:hypothetical protein
MFVTIVVKNGIRREIIVPEQLEVLKWVVQPFMDICHVENVGKDLNVHSVITMER